MSETGHEWNEAEWLDDETIAPMPRTTIRAIRAWAADPVCPRCARRRWACICEVCLTCGRYRWACVCPRSDAMTGLIETPEESVAIVDQNLRSMGSAGLTARPMPRRHQPDTHRGDRR